MLLYFFQHIHPPTIPAAQARWRYTLGAGGIAIFLVLVLVVSGALEMFFYIPSTEEAALSIQTLSYLVPFGGLVGNLQFPVRPAAAGGKCNPPSTCNIYRLICTTQAVQLPFRPGSFRPGSAA